MSDSSTVEGSSQVRCEAEQDGKLLQGWRGQWRSAAEAYLKHVHQYHEDVELLGLVDRLRAEREAQAA